MKILDQIKIDLRDVKTGVQLPVYVDAYDSSLGRKWLGALNNLLTNDYHLEKNYCFFGWPMHERNAEYICNQINSSIQSINLADLGYTINDHFTTDNTINSGPIGHREIGCTLVQDKMNWLHRYFEDLQGVSGRMSPYYTKADPATRWHIRQLNLLCHEYESLVLSMRKQQYNIEWMRPSQLMCWLNAPRFVLDQDDYELFGVETINRRLGGVFVGVNKAVGKHHWEVFNDEGRDSRVGELITSTLKSQTEAAGDFDIEWANNPGDFPWQQETLRQFREWLVNNGFDPEDKTLTIGHPQVGQVDLEQSFGTSFYRDIWDRVGQHLDVYKITTSDAQAIYEYHWSDSDFIQRQVTRIQQGN